MINTRSFYILLFTVESSLSIEDKSIEGSNINTQQDTATSETAQDNNLFDTILLADSNASFKRNHSIPRSGDNHES